MYIHSAIEDTVRRISDTFRVLLLTGPRQVGKTTLLRLLAYRFADVPYDEERK